MPSPLIKICGISTAETLAACLAARAEWCGFVFYPPSPRNLAFDQAAVLAQQAADKIGRAGVFVDPDDDLLTKAVAAGKLDALQVHRVTAERRAQIQTRFGLPVWAVLEVSQPKDLAACGHYEAFDRLIYDAKTPKGGLPGGMGLAFDWTMLNQITHPGPWGLAGGLNPTNVAEAARQTKAPLVDVSSGVESAPGVKDVDKIRAFCQAARAL